MTNSNAFLSVLNSFPNEVQKDAPFRAALVLGQKLAAQLGTSGVGNNPALIVGDFFDAQLDDKWLVSKYRETLNSLADQFRRGGLNLEDFHTKRLRLLAEQKIKDDARANRVDPPLPPGKTREQLFSDLKTAANTREAIRDEVKSLSDREKPDPIKTYRDELKQKLQYATPAERGRLKARLEILEAKIAENDAAAAEQIRQEDFNANPLVINARAMVDAIRHPEIVYDGVPDVATKFQRLKAITAASGEFIDPEHFNSVVSTALAELEAEALAISEKRHR